MKSPNLISIFTVNREKVAGGGVPFVLYTDKTQRDKDAMDLCRIIGATAHEIGDHVFIIKR
ncbi:MAG: hypothetical protein IJR47_05235 [Clostridia bacterium]|nr:hypothetical protein [Clostridia bacterium]